MSHNGLTAAIQKMRNEGLSETFIDVFSRFYGILESSESSYIFERDVEAVRDLPRFGEKSSSLPETGWALDFAIIKLNGGLGTTMGLAKAKSLLPVKGDLTFLDIIARNTLCLRSLTGAKLPLVFMNSFRTSADTLEYLSRYENIQSAKVSLEFLQHHEPKLLLETLEPVSYLEDPSLEWCPPGHGDFYSSIYDSGVLKSLLESGFRYAFVSNSDNLGATLDPEIATYFKSSGAAMMLELADKTPSDIKGGHLVKTSDGKMTLREVAQIDPTEMEIALNPQNHPYFNTNSLWFDLVQLAEALNAQKGVLHLPLIKNIKHVNPLDGTSDKVIQIESAIAAAVSNFDNSSAIVIDRSRFIPVKTNDDLSSLRSEKYQLDENFNLCTDSLASSRKNSDANSDAN